MNPKRLRQMLLIIITALLGVGIIAVYSSSAMASEATYGGTSWFIFRHVVSIACGLLLAVACLFVPYPRIQQSARWLFLASAVLLVLVMLFGEEVGGARRWFHLGRWSVQPSEFAQLSLVIYLADLIARRSGTLQHFRTGLLPPLIATGLMAGLVLIQPDLGTAIAMGAVALLLLSVANARWQHLALIVVLGAVALVVLIASAEYRRQRILAFMDPWQDPRGIGYQILQSFFSMASGGLTGVGIGASMQKLFFLPSAHTDFIFAIIGEELGLIGATAVLALFALLIICGFRIAMNAPDLFSKYLVCGLIGMMGLEAMVNIAVVTGLMPTKGLPLPFISYGGTSMVVNLIACALVFQASRHAEAGWSGR